MKNIVLLKSQKTTLSKWILIARKHVYLELYPDTCQWSLHVPVFAQAKLIFVHVNVQLGHINIDLFA